MREIEAAVMNAHQLAQTHPYRIKHLEDMSLERYYKFLFYLMGQLKPRLAVELGIFRGFGLAHMAAGCSSATVVGVDHKIHDWLGAIKPYQNIQTYKMDSVKFLEKYKGPAIGLLHIDTEHTPRQVGRELRSALPRMVRGGVICIDDIFISSDMCRWWRTLENLNKLPFPDMHSTGYGVIICNGPI